jgi:hypothetical protein
MIELNYTLINTVTEFGYGNGDGAGYPEGSGWGFGAELGGAGTAELGAPAGRGVDDGFGFSIGTL